MSKLSGNPFVSHGRTQDTMTMTMTMTMTYDILAIIGVNKVWGGQSPSPIILFESENRIIRRGLGEYFSSVSEFHVVGNEEMNVGNENGK